MALKDIIVRDLTEEDMVEVSSWFTDRKWSMAPAPGILPASAYVAELDGELLSVAWMYITNSGLAFVDWIATNPKSGVRGIISVQKVFKYIDKLIARTGNIRACVSYTHNDKLAKYMSKKCGYNLDNTKVNILTRTYKEGEAHG